MVKNIPHFIKFYDSQTNSSQSKMLGFFILITQILLQSVFCASTVPRRDAEVTFDKTVFF